MSPVIQAGSTFRIFDEAITAYDLLPRNTYRVCFDPMSGHYLQRIPDMTPSSEKMYGNGQERIARIMAGWEKMHRSYGVLMSGNGGMGKTMLMRNLACQMQEKFELPIVIVDSPSPGLVAYLDSLDACIVIFDEFEKNFSTESEEGDQQAQFLTLFDGLSSTKRMYIVTVNDLSSLNDFIVNRTGRFHAHLRFSYPSAESIEEYLLDAGVDADNVAKVVQFAATSPLNYDHLRAIAFEMTQVGGDFTDVVGDLNIKSVKAEMFDVILTTSTGMTFKTTHKAFMRGTARPYFEYGDDRIYLSIDTSKGVYKEGSHVFPREALSLSAPYNSDEQKKALGSPVSCSMSLATDDAISYTF